MNSSVLWDLISLSHIGLWESIDQDLLQKTGLSLVWFNVLRALSTSDEGLRLQDLAEQVFHSQSGTTRLVDRMVNDGLVARHQCAKDRRGIYAILTEAGKAKFHEVLPIWESSLNEKFAAHLTDEDGQALHRIFTRLLVPGAKPKCQLVEVC